MEEQPNLIYESFLVNDRKDSYHIPTVVDDYSFSEVRNSFSPVNIEETWPKTDIDCSLGHVPALFNDSEEEWGFEFDNSFKSWIGPAICDSLHEFQQFECPLSANYAKNEIKYFSKLAPDSPSPIWKGAPKTTNKSSFGSANTTQAQPKIYGYIIDVIEHGMRTQSTRAGRPKQEFDTSPGTVRAFYEDYVGTLQELIENNYSQKRSDTFRNTIFSYLKKLPIKLREMSCSISEPKSRKLSIFLDAFLTPFVTCFTPYFDISTVPESKVEMFLYFICICYPEDKWNKILNVIYQEDSMPKEKIERIKKILCMRKGKSKKDITQFILANPCFQLYNDKILQQLSHDSFDEQASLMVKDFILHPEK